MTAAPSSPYRSALPDAQFIAHIAGWSADQTAIMLKFVWHAYDSMIADMPYVEPRDLERGITQLLERRIQDAMTGDEPYYVQHGPYEHETMAQPPAQPPSYDLAFVLRAEERIMWPIEAKVMETPNQIADYVRDVNNEFITCRYAPFSDAGAMLGYLLSGSANDAFENIGEKLGCNLTNLPALSMRAHRISDHQRKVSTGKAYPPAFRCHHLLMEFFDLSRAKKT